MENLDLLAEIVKQFEEEKMILNGELASLIKKTNEIGVNQQNVANQMSAKKTEAASITKEGIEKYKKFWYSLSPNHAPPCPFCFIINGKHSDLKAEPATRKPEHFRCQECDKWIHASLP